MIQSLKKNNKGFSLIELLVVVAILGILAVVLVPQYVQYLERSRATTDLYTLGEILHAAEIDAAATEGAKTATTVAITATGGVTITGPTGVTSIVGTSAQLRSAAAKVAADHTIEFNSTTHKAGWGTGGTKTTEAEFSAIVTATGKTA